MGRRKCRSCCAPCGFGCDPCLGSVEINAGTCGGATWTYPLADPCEGVVSQVDPFCQKSDCLIDKCASSSVASLISTTYCETTTQCQPNCSVYGIPGIRWTVRRDDEEHKLVTRVHKKYQYTITFVGDKTFKIQVICTTYMTIQSVITSFTRRTYLSDCKTPRVFPCPPYDGTTPLTLTNTTSYTIPVDINDCDVSLVPYDQGFKNGCNQLPHVPFGSIKTDECNGVEVEYFSGLIGQAIYEDKFELAACGDFLDSYTLPRINPSFAASGTVQYHPGSLVINCVPCPDVNWSLDDCWPSTITVTLA